MREGEGEGEESPQVRDGEREARRGWNRGRVKGEAGRG